MNTTTEHHDPTELADLSGELLMVTPEPKKGRAAPCEFDEKYIQAFIAAPHLGKRAAYIQATGSNTSYGRQR